MALYILFSPQIEGMKFEWFLSKTTNQEKLENYKSEIPQKNNSCESEDRRNPQKITKYNY